MIRLPPADLHFIRAQKEEALPLVAELYGLELAAVRAVREGRVIFGAAMPLPLLRDLVRQRREALQIDKFAAQQQEAWLG